MLATKSGQKIRFGEDLDTLLGRQEMAVRQIVWKAYQDVATTDAVKKDFAENRVRFKDYVSPYKVRKVGTKPAGGWPLVIAMHGGGNAPQELNDSQWKQMQTYYKDQIPGPATNISPYALRIIPGMASTTVTCRR